MAESLAIWSAFSRTDQPAMFPHPPERFIVYLPAAAILHRYCKKSRWTNFGITWFCRPLWSDVFTE